MEDNNKIYETIIDYLSHQLNENEIETFENWLKEADENYKLFKKIEQYWNYSDITDAVQKNNAWLLLISNTEERRRGFLKRNTFSIAVAATILILISAGWFLKTTTTKMVNIVTDKHTFKRDTLENGCIVFLYPSSSIKIDNNYSNAEYQVINLRGQAFFIVPPKLGKTVKINIGEASISVKGTSFKVNGTNNAEVSVIVESGEVVMKSNSSKENQLLVHAGEEACYYKDRDLFSKKLKSENIYVIYQPVRFTNTQ